MSVLSQGGSPTVARFGDTHWSDIVSAMDKQHPIANPAEIEDELREVLRAFAG